MFRRCDRPVELGSYERPVACDVLCGSADFLREGWLMFKGCDRPVELGSYKKPVACDVVCGSADLLREER